MSDGIQTIANITQILSLFVAFIALSLQAVDSYLKYRTHLAPTLTRLQRELQQYLVIIRYSAVASLFFLFGSCAATPTTRIVVDLQATNTALNQTITSLTLSNPVVSGVTENFQPTPENQSPAPLINTSPAPTNVPEAPRLVAFSDDFNQGLKAEWSIVNGEWLVIEDRLSPVRFEFSGLAQITVGGSDWTNYDFTVDIGNLTTDYEDIPNITFRPRFQNRDNYPYFAIGGRQAVCGIRRNGRDAPLEPVKHNLPIAKVRVKTTDNKFELYINETLICSFRDNGFQYGGIMIEARRFQDDVVWMDNLVVTIPSQN